MEENKGVATWKQIYDNIEKYYPPAKASIEWQAGIRGVLYREMKNNKNFKKVGLGIFALKDYQEEKLAEIKQKVRMHPIIEGICIELGNFDNFQTYTPDKSMIFKDNIFLNQLETLKQIPEFTYQEIIAEIKRIDVIWFNKRGFIFPKKTFEVVDSIGTLSEAFNRCLQLIHFDTKFHIIAPEEYRDKFDDKINKEPYLSFKERFAFKNYQEVIKHYGNAVKYNELKKGFL